MPHIIPRGLIKHLEWNPKNPAPVQAVNVSTAPQVRNVELPSEFAKYIQVGMPGLHGQPVVISPFELDGYNGKNYANTHFKLLREGNGQYMPTPGIFSRHLLNLVEAVKHERTLLFADGSEVPDELAVEMYRHATAAHKVVYSGGQAGAWTWLNGKFVKGKGHSDFDLEVVVGLDDKKLATRRSPLAPYLDQEGFADLQFNDDGLPAPESRSATQKYSQGSNVYFWLPVKDAVARFYAISGRACLNCDRDASGSGASLGVFGCAEGAGAKKSGGRV